VKVLGIVCSPRRGGNTEILMQEALDSAREAGAEVELVTLADKTIFPCNACDSCLKTGQCNIDDDMQQIYPKLLEADGIIFGTPVYFWSVSAQAKALIDRTYVFSEGNRKLRNKVAAVIIATGRVGSTSAFSEFSNFCAIHRMVLAGGAIGLGREKGAVRQDTRSMAEAKALGRVVVRYIHRYILGQQVEALELPMKMPARGYPPKT
jgi:multimeric flavodoxin WrbA